MKELILKITGNSGLVGGDIDHEELAEKIVDIIGFAYQEGIDYGVNCPGTPDADYGMSEYLTSAIERKYNPAPDTMAMKENEQ